MRVKLVDGIEYEMTAEEEAQFDAADAAWIAAAPDRDRAAIQDHIDTLERKEQYPRLTRETLLYFAVKEAALQGVDEPTLYGANVGYQKLKDFDAQIAALRAQL